MGIHYKSSQPVKPSNVNLHTRGSRWFPSGIVTTTQGSIMQKQLPLSWVWKAVNGLLIFAIGSATGYTFKYYFKSEQPDQMQEITINGISMKLMDAHPDGANYRLDLCYSLPDAHDWLLTNPSSQEATYILFDEYQVSPFEEGTTTWKYSPSGEVVERCGYLIFYRPDLSFRELKLVVSKIYSYEIEHSDCESLRGRMTDVYNFASLECLEVDGINRWTFAQFPLQILDDRLLMNQINDSLPYKYG